MHIEQPGKVYLLENFGEEKGSQKLEFTRKEMGNHVPGTTNEEVLSMMIDRILTLHRSQPCDENRIAVDHLKMAKSYLVRRRDRVQRHKRLHHGREDENNSAESNDVSG